MFGIGDLCLQPIADRMKRTLLFLSIGFFLVAGIQVQTEVMAWGNLTGIRVDGYLFPFETFFRVTDASGASREDTGKERQPRPSYTREGDRQYIKTLVHGVRYEQQVTDTGRGEACVSVSCQADTTLESKGAFFCIAVPIFPMYAEKGFIAIDEVETATRNIQENTFTGSRLAVQGHTAEVSFETDRPVEWQLKNFPWIHY